MFLVQMFIKRILIVQKNLLLESLYIWAAIEVSKPN